MQLTLDDFVADYPLRRAEEMATHARYIERYRRIRLTPSISCVFQNRQTVWFRVQEILFNAGLNDFDDARTEIDWHRPQLPGVSEWRAAVYVRDDDDLPSVPQLYNAASLVFRLGEYEIAGRFSLPRPDEEAAGITWWATWHVPADAVDWLSEPRAPAGIELTLGDECIAEVDLTEDVRSSLADDLRR